MTGSAEVWFLNGFESPAEQQQVIDAYAKNAPLIAALHKNFEAKRAPTTTPIAVLAHHRHDPAQGVPWALGSGPFLVITVTSSPTHVDGNPRRLARHRRSGRDVFRSRHTCYTPPLSSHAEKVGFR